MPTGTLSNPAGGATPKAQTRGVSRSEADIINIDDSTEKARKKWGNRLSWLPGAPPYPGYSDDTTLSPRPDTDTTRPGPTVALSNPAGVASSEAQTRGVSRSEADINNIHDSTEKSKKKMGEPIILAPLKVLLIPSTVTTNTPSPRTGDASVPTATLSNPAGGASSEAQTRGVSRPEADINNINDSIEKSKKKMGEPIISAPLMALLIPNTVTTNTPSPRHDANTTSSRPTVALSNPAGVASSVAQTRGVSRHEAAIINIIDSTQKSKKKRPPD